MITDTQTRTQLWAHQERAVEFAEDKPGVCLAMDMGTGKSAVAVTLAQTWECRCVLVLCPKSVVGVWPREFLKHAGDDFEILPLIKGTTADKGHKAARFLDRCEIKRKPAVVVINYESAWREPFRTFALNTADFDLLILDECHRIKAPGGRASRFCSELGKVVGKRLGLTGTPMPHSPLDIYAQFRTIQPSVFGYSFAKFKNRYAVTTGPNGTWVDPKQIRNPEELCRKFASISFQVTKEEALTLPEETHINIPVELEPSAFKQYVAMEKHFYLWMEEQAAEVTAANVLVKLLRLQQMTSGFVADDNGTIQRVSEIKQKTLIDLLSDTPEERPVVVFCKFVNDLDVVKEVAKNLDRTYGEISGRQKDLTDHATMPEGIQIMGVQIQSGGVGIDLTRASIAVYYSMGFSLGDYLQSLARLHRPGQRHPVTFFHLIAQGTVDEKVFKALQDRQEVVSNILKGGTNGNARNSG